MLRILSSISSRIFKLDLTPPLSLNYWKRLTRPLSCSRREVLAHRFIAWDGSTNRMGWNWTLVSGGFDSFFISPVSFDQVILAQSWMSASSCSFCSRLRLRWRDCWTRPRIGPPTRSTTRSPSRSHAFYKVGAAGTIFFYGDSTEFGDLTNVKSTVTTPSGWPEGTGKPGKIREIGSSGKRQGNIFIFFTFSEMNNPMSIQLLIFLGISLFSARLLVVLVVLVDPTVRMPVGGVGLVGMGPIPLSIHAMLTK